MLCSSTQRVLSLLISKLKNIKSSLSSMGYSLCESLRILSFAFAMPSAHSETQFHTLLIARLKQNQIQNSLNFLLTQADCLQQTILTNERQSQIEIVPFFVSIQSKKEKQTDLHDLFITPKNANNHKLDRSDTLQKMIKLKMMETSIKQTLFKTKMMYQMMRLESALNMDLMRQSNYWRDESMEVKVD